MIKQLLRDKIGRKRERKKERDRKDLSKKKKKKRVGRGERLDSQVRAETMSPFPTNNT